MGALSPFFNMQNMTNHKLTLEDIARLCNVSRSTVSRVINNHPNVSDPIRERVQRVIRETDFHPNEAARTLASQRSWVIGLVLPRTIAALFTDPYYSRIIQGVAQGCNQSNYTLALFLIATREDEEKIYPRISRKGLLDGVIIQASNVGDSLADRLARSDMPLLMAGRPFRTDIVSSIDINNVAASGVAVQHLVDLGYKRIATITGLPQHTSGIDRIEGYRKTLIENGLPVDERLIAEGDFTEEGGYLAMKKLLAMQPHPDAVFAASDTTAAGAMRATREASLRIPQDIAFVGFDDLLPISPRVTPQLTTIRQPIVRFGTRAVELLIERIENGSLPVRREIMETQLIVRDSCGASLRK